MLTTRSEVAASSNQSHLEFSLSLHPPPPLLLGNPLFTCFRCVKAVKQLTDADPQRGKTLPKVFNAQQRFRETFFAVGQVLGALKAAAERWILVGQVGPRQARDSLC